MTYRIYHRHLSSAIELPELPRTTVAPDLEFRMAHLPPVERPWCDIWTGPAGEPWVRAQRIGSVYRVRYEDRADFLLDLPRAEIVADPFNCGESTLRHFLLDQMIPLLLSVNHTVLHAGAVLLDGRACAFVGPGGAGKSTLTAAFARAGHPMIADDGMLIMTGRQPQAVPAYPGVRLWSDSAAAYAARDFAATGSEGAVKERVGEHFPFADAPVPLEDLFLIDETPADRVSITPLSRREAVMAVLECSYRLELRERGALRAQLERSIEETTALRVWTLAYPRRFDRLDEVVSRIEAHARESGRVTVRTHVAG